MTSQSLTQTELKSLFNYSPETGVFTRLVSVSYNAKVGDVAGSTRKDGYLIIKIKKKKYLAHRLAWLYVYGEWPNEIDHINHTRDDNRICNLRSVSSQGNSRNASLRRNNTSGVCGVDWFNFGNKWRSRITVDGKKIPLGLFDDKFEAICARLSANNKHKFHKNHGQIKR